MRWAHGKASSSNTSAPGVALCCLVVVACCYATATTRGVPIASTAPHSGIAQVRDSGNRRHSPYNGRYGEHTHRHGCSGTRPEPTATHPGTGRFQHAGQADDRRCCWRWHWRWHRRWSGVCGCGTTEPPTHVASLRLPAPQDPRPPARATYPAAQHGAHAACSCTTSQWPPGADTPAASTAPGRQHGLESASTGSGHATHTGGGRRPTRSGHSTAAALAAPGHGCDARGATRLRSGGASHPEQPHGVRDSACGAGVP